MRLRTANSPVLQLDRITTPLLLLAGGQDSVVPWTQAAEVFVGMRRLGRRCTFLLHPAGGHGLGHLSTAGTQALWNRVVGWLRDAGV